MPSQHQIEQFTLAFHMRAVQRLRNDPLLRNQALKVIDRWEEGGVTADSRPYRDYWRQLLSGDLAVLERTVCVDTHEAATLRSMSPLGFVLDESERLALRQQVMAS